MEMSGILQLGFRLCSWGPVLSSALLPQECSFLSTLLGALRSFSCLYFKQMEGRARARNKSWVWGIMGIKGRYQGDFKRQDAREGWHSEIWCQNKGEGQGKPARRVMDQGHCRICSEMSDTVNIAGSFHTGSLMLLQNVWLRYEY